MFVKIKEANGMISLIPEANVSRLGLDKNLVPVDGELVLKTSPGLIQCIDGTYSWEKNAVIPVDGHGWYNKSKCVIVKDDKDLFYLRVPKGVYLYNTCHYTNTGLVNAGLCLVDGKVSSQSECCFDFDNNKWVKDNNSYKDLHGYHSGIGRALSATVAAAKYRIGLEIEKSGWPIPAVRAATRPAIESLGMVFERDGSVSNGFELITPVYDLMDEKIMQDLDVAAPFINVPAIKNAGGHISFSVKGLSDSKLLDKMKGWIPFILSLYRYRLSNTYCKVTTFERFKDRSRHAIHCKGEYIEFRIVGPVKSLQQLKWRVRLFRHIANNLDMPFERIISEATMSGSPLHQLLMQLRVYQDPTKFRKLLLAATNIHNKYVLEGKKEEFISFKKLTKNVFSTI